MKHSSKNLLHHRFRGYLPVVVDVETAGFNAERDALLELAAVTIKQDEDFNFYPSQTKHYHIQPFIGANLDQECLEFNKIDPYHPFRMAKTEAEALSDLFEFLNEEKKRLGCAKCILVGHNAWFDLGFIMAASKRSKLKKSPFHSFTSIDTATLAAVFYGQTVLAKAMKSARIKFDINESHSAIYDAEKTAELFCKIINSYKLF
jgi:ribonuclease T